MLGDAAHATLPHLGQGANMAIDDAYCLAELLGSATATAGAAGIDGALKAYEAARLGKTSSIVKLSRTMGAMNNLAHPVLASARDSLLGIFVRSGLLLKGIAAEITKEPVLELKPRP
jgi:2-polyprenyl-6-methoxyphenol hydroxylase-like FAD-dependent oxidoreductase